MNLTTEEKAIHNSKQKLSLAESTLGRAWRVRRLDQPSRTYLLVELGDPNAIVGVAIVDLVTDEVGVFANLLGVGPHLAIDARMAIRLAAGQEVARAELVWMPCAVSKSPLYPFWQVRTQSGVRYVDQQGNVWDRLEPTVLGG